MDTKQNYELQDQRVLLRPLEESDKEHLLPFALQEPELWQYSLINGAGEQGMERYFKHAMAVAISLDHGNHFGVGSQLPDNLKIMTK